MTPGDFTTRLTVGTGVVTVALALLAAWLAGASAGVGVLAGGVLAVVNVRWLIARALAASAAGSHSTARLVGAGVRFAILLVACGVLLATRLAHPVALLLGFSVLPCQVIAQGLRAARRQG